MLFDYNSLNLLSEVRRDGQPAAKYDWLADGTKLGVCDGSGTDGFEYVGSLIYRKRGSRDIFDPKIWSVKGYEGQSDYGINKLKELGWKR